MAEEATETTDEPDDEPALYPFFSVRGNLAVGTTIRAGYATETGEVDYLVVDMQNVGVGRIEQAFTLAFGWYVDTMQAISEQQQAAEVSETPEQAVEAD